jgi:hypothetical protein
MATKRTKQPDLKSKQGKYFIAKLAGKTKKEAAVIAGYRGQNVTSQIENSVTYKEIEKVYFKDELLNQISVKEIATALKENIKQDNDLGSRNAAIKIALDKIEPDKIIKDEDDKVLVILKG